MRLFIALPIDDKVRASAAAIIGGLKKAGADVKWVEPENLHLTLVFLGEMHEQKITPLKKALTQTAADFRSFHIRFDRLGAFGAPARPKVLWLGIAQGAQALSELFAKLKADLVSVGIIPENEGREFSAHLTLGRVLGSNGLKMLSERMGKTVVPDGLSCPAQSLILFESRLVTSGPTYKSLFESLLRSPV